MSIVFHLFVCCLCVQLSGESGNKTNVGESGNETNLRESGNETNLGESGNETNKQICYVM